MTDNIKTYQGWTNRETWLIHLWLDNEQAIQEQAIVACNTDGEMLQEAAMTLRALVDDLIDDQLAQGRSGFIADMLSDYLDAVNWREIAESFREQDQ